MTLPVNKTEADLSAQADIELRKIGFSTDRGSVAKLFLSVVNKFHSEFYERLEEKHVMSFLSTAKDEFLDMIGFLLHCFRETGESDENYKYRISNQVLSLATSDKTAIELALLCTQDVTDVVMQEHTFGPGSFSCIVLTGSTYANPDKVVECYNVVDKVAGFGIKFEIMLPVFVEVAMDVMLILNTGITTADAQAIRFNVRDAINVYIQTRKLGEPIIINEVAQRIMEQSDDITDYVCKTFIVNRRKAFYVNQTARWCEKFVPSLSDAGIIVR